MDAIDIIIVAIMIEIYGAGWDKVRAGISVGGAGWGSLCASVFCSVDLQCGKNMLARKLRRVDYDGCIPK